MFADAFYDLALLNERDLAHERALTLSETHRGRLVTTAWIFKEVGDALSVPPGRLAFASLLAASRSDPYTTIVPLDENLFNRGVDLYTRRPDKAWSLTDCISLVVMSERGLTGALTGGHHFETGRFPGFAPRMTAHVGHGPKVSTIALSPHGFPRREPIGYLEEVAMSPGLVGPLPSDDLL